MMTAAIIARLGCIGVRLLIALQPRDFRREFGEAVMAEIAADIRAAVPSGTWATAAVVAAALFDSARGLVLERATQVADLRSTMQNALFTDVRQAIRLLRRDRGFTAVALMTLSAGLAMCVVVAVLVNAYLWRGLPYPESERLFTVEYAAPGTPWPSGMEALDWRSIDDVVDLAISWDLDGFSLRGGPAPEVVQGTWVTPGYVEGFAVRPVLGRGFAAEDFDAGRPMVAIISHRLWQTRFNGDPAIVGRTFEAYVNDRPNEVESFQVIGVLSSSHWHLDAFTEILAPLRAPSYPYVVRLRDGVLPSTAADRITALVRGGTSGFTDTWRAGLRSTHSRYVERIRPLLMAVAIGTGLVLLIACANVSVLLTVRATRRRHETAVRQALGASAGQLTRATAAEPVILGGVAAASGLLLAWGALAALAPVIDHYLGRPVPGGTASLQLDAGTILAALALALAVVAVCAIVPAWVARRTPLAMAVVGGPRGATDGPVAGRARAALIAVEVAACLTLLAGAGLTIQSAVRMLNVDMGLDARDVIVGRYSLRPRGYPDEAARAGFHERVLARAGGLASIEAIAFANAWPLQQSPIRDVGGAAASYQTRAGIVGVTADYFDALRIPVHAGRAFSPADRFGTEPVAIVSRALADRVWRSDGAVGRTLFVAPAPGSTAAPSAFTVIGVAGDVRHTHTDADLADVYVPLLQSPSSGVFAYVRVGGNAAAAERDVRQLLASIDSEVGFVAARPLAQILDQQRAGARLLASLLVVFALFAAALSLVGIYGVIAYTVKQREREIAVRMAIGADRQAVSRLFLAQGTKLLGAGLSVGVAGALALGQVLRTQLFDVQPADPVVIAGAMVAFAICGLAAIAWPARAAAAVDPARILKE